MEISVTQFGRELSKNKYTWNEETRTFSTNENNLVLDFFGIEEVNFNTGHDCTFITSHNCTFKTGSGCTFDTGHNCTFDTGSSCFFDTSHNCTFKTGSYCNFKTGHDCTFNSVHNCVIIRRNVFEIIQVPENNTNELNQYQIKGFEIIKDTKTITIDGKEIEISVENFENLKEQLLEN